MRPILLLGLVAAALACDSCYGPSSEVIHERNVRRMQPEAQDATVGPKAPLEWGQLNFLHTVSPLLFAKVQSHMERILIDGADRRIRMVGWKGI